MEVVIQQQREVEAEGLGTGNVLGGLQQSHCLASGQAVSNFNLLEEREGSWERMCLIWPFLSMKLGKRRPENGMVGLSAERLRSSAAHPSHIHPSSAPHGCFFSLQTPAKPSGADRGRGASWRTAKPSVSPPWWPRAGLGGIPTTAPSTSVISTLRAPAPTPWLGSVGTTPHWCLSRWRARIRSGMG